MLPIDSRCHLLGQQHRARVGADPAELVRSHPRDRPQYLEPRNHKISGVQDRTTQLQGKSHHQISGVQEITPKLLYMW
jgi:hypothetical protein